MRVGVDATVWTNRRGYGRFARNAVGRLVDLDRDATYVLVTDEQSAAEAEFPAGASVQAVALSRQPTEAASADSYRPPTDLLKLGATVSRARFDAFLFPSVYTYFPTLGVPTVVGLHDAIADDFPELTLPSRRARAFWQAKQKLAIARARRLFTVSESARAEISQRLGLAPERLAVVPEAPDAVFTPRDPAEIDAARAEIGLAPGERYLLYAGGISPHKDIGTLLDAFAQLEARPKLVMVGALEGDAYLSAAAAVREKIAALGLAAEAVLPGFVPDEALAALYSGAAVVALPSLAEGFGLPAVEAAACGAPVVLSDISAHRETLGDDALFFPPRDAPVLAERIRHLLGSDMLRRSLGERGHARVARYTWDAAAEALRTLVHEAAR
ncbi:MAG TPA: glycosyltransferase family 1 protein [Gaiellaceae bacterium]|jgi:glycosyltransferase involved in cell wall biosynthesis|nr:glycosyltransferase family 1 protein [Gaiellaceae bacterium]